MKQISSLSRVNAVVVGIAVLLLGLAPVSAGAIANHSDVQDPQYDNTSDNASGNTVAPAKTSSPQYSTDPAQPQSSRPAIMPTEYSAAIPSSELPAGAITLEITVTAIVLPNRHIVTDATGQIIRITSNTLEDIQPEVFDQIPTDANQRPLTDALYAQYRSHVPVGTAARGILYESGIPLKAAASSNDDSVSDLPVAVISARSNRL